MILALLFALAVTVPNLDGVLRLFSRDSLAHACPISATEALTNAHVANEYFVWSSRGVSGTLAPGHDSSYRDLSWIKPEGETQFPTWYPIATEAPVEGQRLWFVGYDWRDSGKAFGPRVFSVEVIRVIGGHVAYKPAGVPGSSGSCVLNEKGEVVAINKGGLDLEDKSRVGIAVGIWGPWLQIGEAK